MIFHMEILTKLVIVYILAIYLYMLINIAHNNYIRTSQQKTSAHANVRFLFRVCCSHFAFSLHLLVRGP